MVAFSFSFSFSILFSLILITQSSSSSSTHLSNFHPDIQLSGDAHVVAATHVRLTRAAPSSSGLLRGLHPLAFSSPATSLSTDFSFAVSPVPGDGFLLILAPAAAGNVSDFVAVEFHASSDENKRNQVGIDVGSRVSVAGANVPDVNLVLNSGEKLKAWVDYEGSSKALEVRLSKLGEEKPGKPMVSHWIDFFEMWGGDPVFAGISSSNGPHSAQVVTVYSWRLTLRDASKGLHSMPADPRPPSQDDHRMFCPLTLLAGLIFGTGCVALFTFVVLFTWVIFLPGRQDHSLVKIPDHPHDIRYQRIDVAVDKNAQHDET
ncbi:L-type lectin-domain containing receptor kinase VIII.2 [Cajanus cajan]|nr:L-type lectin-domain containing receptor kinase VIII.2 [Cajanus cajan]